MNIFVGNIAYSTSEDQIRDLFEEFGEVSAVKMISDRDTGRFRGFGFVEMEDEAGRNAINTLNDREVNGRNLQVNEAQAREDRPQRDRRNFRR